MRKSELKLKGIYLAYDHGMEHGPTDFNTKNVSPEYILDIARKAEVDAVVLLKGSAKNHYKKSSGVPLILKLNQKTNLYEGEPISTQVCSVKEAIKLGASAVGYAVYAGSKYEHIMLAEFGKIQEEAKKYGLPTIMWSYPRGEAIKDEESPETIAYAARIAMEMGADVVKIKYPDDDSNLEWIVKCADKTRVFFAGGKEVSDNEFERRVEKAISAGFSGVAVGRHMWQSENPVGRIKKIRETINSV
jgi:class I fructose-bisphosphate aldolase